MKYYSENLKRFYDTLDECKEADEKFLAEKKEKEERKLKLSEERKARAKEVEDAYKAVINAESTYSELLSNFIKDYGSFHMTFSEPCKRANSLQNLLDLIFNI